MNKTADFSEQDRLLLLTDRCVKCGLCSTYCPTYKISGDENESPRGRIALAQALASGSLSTPSKVDLHMNNCLHCRRCEKVCPSGVKFGQIKDLANHVLDIQINSDKKQRLAERIIRIISLASHIQWQRRIRIIQLSKITGLFFLGRVFSRYKNYLPRKIYSIKKAPSPTEAGKNPVSFFTGCLSHVFDSKTLNDSISLLNLCGYEVNIPDQQKCCGGLAQHSGYSEIAEICMQQNESSFSNNPDQPILFTATGCGMSLKEQNGLLAKNSEEICHFLNSSHSLKQMQFSPLENTVVIHTPCSEKNVLNQFGETQKLLSLIPKLRVVSLAENSSCCGAGGSYMITHKEKSIKIRETVLSDIISAKPDLLVSNNYTCRMHIQAGLKEKALDIPAMHPISLLWQQIKK